MIKSRSLSNNRFNFNLNLFKILSLFLIVVMILFIPLVIKRSIKISKINCVSQFGDCHAELNSNLSYALGRDYKTVKKYIEDILSKNPQVEGYLIQYRIPSTIKVEVNLKKPKYLVYVKDSQQTFQVGGDGTVLTLSGASDLPKIIVEDLNMVEGEKISNDFKNACLLIENLNFLYAIKEGEIQKNILKVQTQDGISILIPLDVDINLSIGGLRLIFSRLNDGSEGIRMEDIREIDLRFKNPILRKK